MNIFRAFFPQNQGTYFKIFKKSRVELLPLSPSSYAPGALGLHGCDFTVLEKKIALFKGSLQ